MKLKSLSLLSFSFIAFCFTVAKATTFNIQNNCSYTVWAAAVPGGGRRLDGGGTWDLNVSTTKGNRIWGRTNCQFDGAGRGKCQTGDCGGLLQCQAYGAPPNTLAEFALNQLSNLDFFDISLVDGFNVPMEFSPTSGTCSRGIRCVADIVGQCPNELKAPGGCNNPCRVFKTDQYCCDSGTCNTTEFSRFFKARCPDAYSYPKDDQTSTFTCPGGTNYRVVFCPIGSEKNRTAGSEKNRTAAGEKNRTAAGEKNKPKEKNRAAFIVGITVFVAVFSLILILALVYTKTKREENEEVLPDICTRPDIFSYSELKAITEGFSPSKKLGEGGFGAVYKGAFSDGRVVAVKQLSLASKQGKSQFIAEVATISAVRHRNLVKLHGYCIKGKRHLLVYEYLENKSLDQALFGHNHLLLDWSTRYNICLATARGLAYLHEECKPRILHRDIKASNILLDAELCPKISDFGLAKLCDDNKSHISTRVAGTIGYMAPEYALRGHLTEKADVFSFGIVALEILSGRPNSDNSLDDDKIYLLGWAWDLHENNRSLDLVDPNLADFDENEALRVVMVGLLCTQGSPSMRPPMSRVVAMLAGDIEANGVLTRPSYLTDWNFRDLTGSL